MTIDADRPQDVMNASGASAPRPGGERREERRDETSAPSRKRGKPRLERAHKTVIGTVEALPGAPRSGSA